MARLTIGNLDDHVIDRLQERARANQRSLEGKIRHVLTERSAGDPTKYLYAGTRGESRGILETQRVWESIPEQIRMGGPEATGDFLAGKDWRHIVAQQRGREPRVRQRAVGRASLNRARDAERMTAAESRAVLARRAR